MQTVGCGNVGSYHTTPLPSPHGACTMNTITKSASTNVIVAIDLGKYKSVACVCDQATGEFRFVTFDTTRAEMRKLVDKEQAVYAGRPSAPGCFFEILAQVDGLAASLLKHLPRKRHGRRPYPAGSSRCCLVVMTPWPNKAAVRIFESRGSANRGKPSEITACRFAPGRSFLSRHPHQAITTTHC